MIRSDPHTRANTRSQDSNLQVPMIPITKPLFDEDDMTIIREPLQSGWVVQGKYVRRFERLFSEFTKSRHSIATTSCTTALHVCMAALGVGPDDEVLVPAFTWVSTANCVEYMGATPVFVDVDLRTFNIDIAKIEEKITSRTKGIIPVHLFGLAADMDPILEIAERHKLFIVEDAACGFGSWYKGRHAGTLGDFGCFSFHPRKSITTGEGGMITTQSDERESFCRMLRDHGAAKSDFQRHGEQSSYLLPAYNHLGYNFRMTDIQGALGVAQMQKSNLILQSRRQVAERYNQLLKGMGCLQLPLEQKDYVHGYQSYTCLFGSEEPSLQNWEKPHQQRNRIMAALENKGIMTRQGTHAAAHLDYYSKKYGITPAQYPNAFLAEKLSISLPLYAQMLEEESNRVVHELRGECRS